MKITIAGFGSVFPTDETPFSLENYPVSPKTYLDRTSALALAACGLALQNAGLTGPFDGEFGLSLGTQFGCIETMRLFEEKLSQSGPRAVSPLLFSHSYFNSPAAILSIEWGFKGSHSTFCGSNCAEDALQNAIDVLRLGQATRMACGFADSLSTARQWRQESAPSEGSAFWILEADGPGEEVELEAKALLEKFSCQEPQI